MSRHDSKRHGLPVIHDRAAGIDIGSCFHVVAVPVDLAKEAVQTFKAFTADLVRMANWLVSLGITTVAMESTGVDPVTPQLTLFNEAESVVEAVAEATDEEVVTPTKCRGERQPYRLPSSRRSSELSMCRYPIPTGENFPRLVAVVLLGLWLMP